MERYFVEIDAEKYESDGEIYIIAPPFCWSALCERESSPLPKSGFEIHRKEYLCRFIRATGSQRGAVAEYLLRKKDGQGKVLATNRELAAATGVSLGTVSALLRDLRAAGCVKCRTGSVMLNPGVAHRGDRRREAVLLKLYETFENRP